MQRAVLIANAPFAWTTDLARLAAGAEPLLAADGGANRAAALGLRPRAVVGDLDSILPGVRGWIGEERMVRRPDQDRTDLDKALEYAADELGVEACDVLGAVGGRIDHAVGNLGLLARLARGERLRFVESDHEVVAVAGSAGLASRSGETWSFWTFDPAVRVTLGCVRWPVEDVRLEPTGRPSISNVATGDEVRVAVDRGSVLAVRWRS